MTSDDKTQWDYSQVPWSNWEFNVFEFGNDESEYEVVNIRDTGVHGYYFNNHANIASYGGHGGWSMGFDEFLLAIETRPDRFSDPVFQEVCALIKAHRVPAP